MVSGLLLIALIFFVFAQAAFTRSGGQSAADAAALAAVREARDQLYDDFLDAIDGDGDLGEILDGEDYQTSAACDAAAELADRNDADVTSCAEDGPRGYRVGIRTRDTVGQSVIPGTENETAVASATAVIHSLCEVDSEEEDRIELDCEDRDWDFDPGDQDELPEARDLFKIHLED
jgi:hypothetical protein